MVGHKHSRWMFTKAECSKNLQIENRSLSSQRRSLHGFQTSQFICDQFGYKLCLLSLQNHAWHRFQAFAHRHLKSLCCLIRIWADTLSLTGPLFRPAALHRIQFRTCCFVPMSYFTQRPMTVRKIERSNGRGFGRQQLLSNSIENFISHEKK